MEIDKEIATPAEVLEQLEAMNLAVLFKDLVDYAKFKMKGGSLVDAEKIVGDVFERVTNGIRKWNKSYTFKRFLIGAVSSLVNQYNQQFGKMVIDFDYSIEVEQISATSVADSGKLEELITKVTEKLKSHIPPPDEIEEMVFECWINEIKKPSEVADFWNLDVKEVYKATKRLERKLNPIRELLNTSCDEQE